MPSEWNETQNIVTRIHVGSTQELPHTTKWQWESDDVTRRKQRHSQRCVHVEANRQTVGNLLDV